MPRHLVVFDLDETLVHASVSPLQHKKVASIGDLNVYARPHVDDLISFALGEFDVGVWSSASPTYVQQVASALFPSKDLRFVWAADRCIQRPDVQTGGYLYIKDLRKLRSLGYEAQGITMVDDTPDKLRRQPRQLLRVAPFQGDVEDVELLRVKDELARRLGPANMSNRADG